MADRPTRADGTECVGAQFTARHPDSVYFGLARVIRETRREIADLRTLVEETCPAASKTDQPEAGDRMSTAGALEPCKP